MSCSRLVGSSVALVLLLGGCPSATDGPADADDGRSAEDPALRDRCTRAIEHITLGIYPDAAKPKGGELAVVRGINAAAITQCTQEGLTEAQAACFTSGSLDDTLASVRTCLGERETWPSWFAGSGVAVP